MKKILLGLGTIGVVVTPISIAISCSNSNTNNHSISTDIGIIVKALAIKEKADVTSAAEWFKEESKRFGKKYEEADTISEKDKIRRETYGQIIKGIATIDISGEINSFVSTTREDDANGLKEIFDHAYSLTISIQTETDAEKYGVTLEEVRRTETNTNLLKLVAIGDIANDDKQITIGEKATPIDEVVSALESTDATTTKTEAEFKAISILEKEVTGDDLETELGIQYTIPTTPDGLNVRVSKLAGSLVVTYIVKATNVDEVTLNVDIKYYKHDFTADKALLEDMEKQSTKTKSTLKAEIGNLVKDNEVDYLLLGVTVPTFSDGNVSVRFQVVTPYDDTTGQIEVKAQISYGYNAETINLTFYASDGVAPTP